MAKPRIKLTTEETTERLTQVQRIFEKFGGARQLRNALWEVDCKLEYSTVYRWAYVKGKSSGTGGIIPTHLWPSILAAARIHGIIITSEDLDPRPIETKVTRTIQHIVNPVPIKRRVKEEPDIFS